MPRWRALPDELDPQVREFASQLRRLVDRSGLSIAAVADRTGYSKTSWERYLNGRLLAPKGAIVALAEVTGTNPIHLTTMWELAERAWSRSEARHDMTMEAIRISQARAALGEFGPTPAKGSNGKQSRKGGSTTVTPGIAGPAGVSPTVPPMVPPTVPPQPTAPDVQDSVGGDVRGGASRPGSSAGTGGGAGTGSSGSSSVANSWGLAGYERPAQAPGRGAGSTPEASGRNSGASVGVGAGASGSGAGASAGASGAFGPPPGGTPPQDARPPSGGSADAARRRRRLTMFLAGIVGTLVVIAAAVFLTRGGGDKKDESTPKSPTTSAAVDPDLPVGVKCSGSSCTGKDPENMGCGGTLATTTTSVTVGTTLVEVRYSKTCGAAWARITQAAAGDKVEVSSGAAAKQTGAVDTDTDAYTPMVAVKDAGDAKACATLKAGLKGCTK
ncbi:DUF2690 domain-containing protein [Streptomyces sp. NPDC005485]|uniref:helix-turn-helix domain-containing protein n=1 Tax=Streptomyces sp. NPDC005485 TaxID=3155591 RepID=UPI00339DCA46